MRSGRKASRRDRSPLDQWGCFISGKTTLSKTTRTKRDTPWNSTARDFASRYKQYEVQIPMKVAANIPPQRVATSSSKHMQTITASTKVSPFKRTSLASLTVRSCAVFWMMRPVAMNEWICLATANCRKWMWSCGVSKRACSPTESALEQCMPPSSAWYTTTTAELAQRRARRSFGTCRDCERNLVSMAR